MPNWLVLRSCARFSFDLCFLFFPLFFFFFFCFFTHSPNLEFVDLRFCCGHRVSHPDRYLNHRSRSPRVWSSVGDL